MKIQRKRPINTIFFSTIVFAVIPLIFLVSFLFAYTLRQNLKHQEQILENNAESVGDSIAIGYNDLKSKINTVMHSMDFVLISNNSNRQLLYRKMRDLSSRLADTAFVYDEVLAIVLYNSSCGYYYPVYQYNSAERLSDELKSFLNRLSYEHVTEDLVLFPEDHPLLAYRITSRYGTMMLILDPEKNRLFQAYNQNAVNEQRLYLTGSPDSSDRQSVEIVTPLKSYGISIVSRNNPGAIFRITQPLQWILLIAIILVVLGFLGELRYLKNILLSPLTYLSDAFRIISSENPDYRIERNSSVIEIDTFYQGFNRMMDDTQAAERKSHEHQLDAVRAKLQYLQLQIRPHFYLNCLKSIYSLSEMGDQERVGKLVLDLSEYLRYTFQDVKSFIPLVKELETIQSYVDLCSNIYSEISLEYDLATEVTKMQCLPLSLLTFVENAIKHNQSDKKLLISIMVSTLEEDGQRYVDAEIRNSGGGFTDEALDTLNHADPSVIVYQRNQVGISNVRYRLWLLYGDSAKLSFANKEGWASVRIRYPFESISKEENPG